MSDKVKWGIIGLGNIARSFASDIQLVSNAELVAVASRDLENARAFAKEFNASTSYGNYEDLYADANVDAIYIATPHNFHFEQSKAAMEAGKAVLCEKPITTNPSDCEKLFKIANQQNVYLMEGMWSFFQPAIRKAMEWIDNGRIGNLLHFRSSFGFPATFDPTSRLFNPVLAGGATFDIGIYPVAMMHLFVHSDWDSFEMIRHDRTTGVDDDILLIGKHPNAVTSMLHYSFRTELTNELLLIGTEGTIRVPRFWQSSECHLKCHDGTELHFTDGKKGIGFEFEIEEVSNDILNSKKSSSIVTPDRSKKFQEIMYEILNRN